MNAATLIYLISLFDNLGIFVAIVTVCFLGAGVAGLIATAAYQGIDDDKSIRCFRNAKGFFILSIITGLLCAFIPSEKTMYMMIGARYLQKSNIPSKVEQVINKKLDSYLVEDKREHKE